MHRYEDYIRGNIRARLYPFPFFVVFPITDYYNEVKFLKHTHLLSTSHL